MRAVTFPPPQALSLISELLRVLLVRVMLLCARPHYITPWFLDMFFHEASLFTVVFELLLSLLLLSLPLFWFFFFFFVSVSPHFAITASTLLGGSLLCPCPVCNGSSTNPPSGNCSFPPSFISSEPPSNTEFCQNGSWDARVKPLQTF